MRGSGYFLLVLLLGLPFHAAGGPHGWVGLRFAALLEFLRALPVVFENAPVRHRSLEPVEELCGGVDLIVVLAVWEDAGPSSHLTQRWRRQSRANPSLNPQFPASWVDTGTFVRFDPGEALSVRKEAGRSVCYRPIPYASE